LLLITCVSAAAGSIILLLDSQEDPVKHKFYNDLESLMLSNSNLQNFGYTVPLNLSPPRPMNIVSHRN